MKTSGAAFVQTSPKADVDVTTRLHATQTNLIKWKRDKSIAVLPEYEASRDPFELPDLLICLRLQPEIILLHSLLSTTCKDC